MVENTDRNILTREERKKLREQEQQVTELSGDSEEKGFRGFKNKRPKKLRTRLIPIWLRVIIVLVLVVGFFVLGTMIGYGVIGNGEPTDVLNKETWTHILDIIREGTPEEE